MSALPGKTSTDIESASAMRREFVERITAAWHKSREKIIALGRALIEAKQQLPAGEFSAMIDNDLPFSSWTARQFIRLALDPKMAECWNSNVLPDSATALDELRRLPAQTFDKAVESGVINADMTVQSARDLKEAAASVDATDDEASRWREIERKLHRPNAVSLHRVEVPADGVARNYGQLVALLVEHRNTIGMSQEELDDKTGLPDRYMAKLERPESDNGKSAVHQSFDLWLGGLKVGLRVVSLHDLAGRGTAGVGDATA